MCEYAREGREPGKAETPFPGIPFYAGSDSYTWHNVLFPHVINLLTKRITYLHVAVGRNHKQ